MKYSESGFRAFYHQICGFPLTYPLHEMLIKAGRPELACHNFLMAYCYIDPDEGVMFEVLAAAHRFDTQYYFENVKLKDHITFPVSLVENDDCLYYDDEPTVKRFESKISTLDRYEVSPAMEMSRKLAFLDPHRDPHHPDVVTVHLFKGELHETARVHITGMTDNSVMGTLLDEPEANIGCHKGEQVGFHMRESEDGEICCIDMTPQKSYTAAELEDGSILEQAIEDFDNEHSMESLTWLLQVLRDSHVWVPFDRGGIPALQSADACYLPVFSSAEEMHSNDEFTFMGTRKHFMDAVAMVLNGEEGLDGIILNGFSLAFPMSCEVLEMIKGIESMITD